MSERTRDGGLALYGGVAECAGEWPVWPVCGEEEEALLLDVFRSGKWWFGERVKEFEAGFASFQGAAYGVSCTNGTTAIEMGLRAMGVVEGDEVIVPPYSFIATASAVVTVGAIPVFADIDPRTLCLDPADVERKVTGRTRAVVPVHVAGRAADMDAILGLARRRGLGVLEDSAHAWGSALDGRGLGTWGACGTFSFQVSKNITAGEGGILVTQDGEFAELCRSFTHCGRMKGSAWYDHDVLGSNLRLTEFQAAVLLGQLGRLGGQVARRERSAVILDEGLAGLPGIQLLGVEPRMTRRSYHMYVFRVGEGELGIGRDLFLRALEAEGVPATKGWYRPLYRNGVFQRAHEGPVHGIRAPLAGKGVDYRGVDCPVCEQVCLDAVWIPQHVLLADEGLMRGVVRAVRKVVEAADVLRERGLED